MRVLVCGGRSFFDVPLLKRTLDEFHKATPITVLIQGTARGADRLAAHWAQTHKIPTEGYEPDWKRYGNSAGYIRNGQMLKEGQPEMVIAFQGGRGTKNMIKQATEAGVPVKVIE